MRLIDRLADPRTRAIVVGAHPDDESLWFGGLIARFSSCRWTILCCSIPPRDPIRAFKFFGACESLGAQGWLLPFQELGKDAPLGHLEELPDLSKFDLIATHGAAGEYGHGHHKQISAAIAERYPERTLFSGYRAGGEGAEILRLDRDEYGRKLEALKNYDHAMRFRGQSMPIWQALLLEYGTPGRDFGFDLARETYDQL